MSPDEINALPERPRSYIHALETECDPSGTIRENFRLREENANLRRECATLAAEIPCPSCSDGKRTGLPGNACENCMNTGSAHPELLI